MRVSFCRHRVEALVHLAHRECDDYSLGGLCDGPLATEGSRASGRQHQVQDSHTDCSLGLLGSEAVRSHPRSDLGLIAAQRRFDQCALAVVGACLPGQSAPFRDHRQMAITLCRWTRFGAGHCRRPRRDHHVDAVAVRCDRLVSGGAVICAVGRHPDNPVVKLIDQRCHLRRIVSVLIRQGLRYKYAAGGIDCKMQLRHFRLDFAPRFTSSH
jgi:hypothetical protein